MWSEKLHETSAKGVYYDTFIIPSAYTPGQDQRMGVLLRTRTDMIYNKRYETTIQTGHQWTDATAGGLEAVPPAGSRGRVVAA